MNLITTVLGIGLLALAVSAGVSYVNPNLGATAIAAAQVSSGFQTLTQAYQSRQITGAPPPDTATWKMALFPAYGFEPKSPENTSWSYGASNAGRWFCLWVPTASALMRAALLSASKNYSASSFVVSDTCGTNPGSAQSSSETAVGPGTAASVAATLWVMRDGS